MSTYVKSFFLSAWFLVVLFVCSPSLANSGSPEQRTGSQKQAQLSTAEIIAAQGLSIADSVTVDGDTGYLCKDINNKPYLVLQGKPRSMGYQMGYLMPEGTIRITQEYPRIIFQNAIDTPEIMALCKSVSLPAYLNEEMEGVAQGATDGLARDDLKNSPYAGMTVSYDDVLLVNEGLDALYASILGSMHPKSDEAKILTADAAQMNPGSTAHVQGRNGRTSLPGNTSLRFGCNEFVVSGKATADGRVYHGRDFMFPAGVYDTENNRGLYSDYACMAIYLPTQGYPFTAVLVPGFVGQTTALNSKGLSMGQDVANALCTRSNPGLSSCFVVRDIIQNCANLDEAVAWMRQQDRGVSWLYVMAHPERSDLYTNGIVIEEGMQDPPFEGPELLPVWEQLLFYGAIKKLDSLDDASLPEDGLMIRNQEWQYPDAFKYSLFFPKQMESWPDVVMTTNHFIIPRMALTQILPLWGIIRSLMETVGRYNVLYVLMQAEFGQDQNNRFGLDYERARDLIDFLNPYSPYWNESRNHRNLFPGYATVYSKGGPIGGHHALIDNQALTLEALFGYFNEDEPWAKVNLKAFLP